MASIQTYEIRLLGTLEGQLTVNTLYARLVNPDVGDEVVVPMATALAQYVGSDVLDEFLGCCIPTFEIGFVRADRANNVLGDSPYVFEQHVEAVGEVGSWQPSGTTSGMPSTVAALLHKYYQRQGKVGRSTTYIPGVPEDGFAGSTMTSLYNTAMQALASQLQQNPIIGTDPDLYQVTFGVLWDPSPKTAQDPEVRSFAGFLQILVGQVAGTQRRRRLGRGV